MCLFGVVPRLGAAHVAVDAHERQIDSYLNPTKHPLLIVRVSVLVVRTEESACIICPPRLSGCHQVQSACYLAFQCLPVIAYITGPVDGSVALYACKSAACQNHRITVGLIFLQSVINGLVYLVGICVPIEFTGYFSACHQSALKVVVLGFGCILPPGIYTCGEQFLAEVFPIGICRIGVEEIYPVSTVYVITGGIHLTAYL